MRQEHPFHMYDAILKQPEAVRTVIVQNEDSIRCVAGRLRQVKRIFLVGIGTPYHAAEISRYIARSIARNTEIHAVHSFEFVHYTPALGDEEYDHTLPGGICYLDEMGAVCRCLNWRDGQ